MKRDARVRVAVNGFGVIGKRVADAVALQDDLTLVGVADVISDYRIRVAVERGYPVFAATREARDVMAAAGIVVAGALGDLLGGVDVVVDCTRRRSAHRTAPATRPPA